MINNGKKIMQLIKYYIIWLQENVCVIELNLKLTYVQLLIILLLHTKEMAIIRFMFKIMVLHQIIGAKWHPLILH